jgi:transposase
MVYVKKTTVCSFQRYTMQIEGFEKLLGFKGFIIDKITYSPEIVQYELHRDKRRKMICPNCFRNMFSNKPITRTVFDLPIGTARCVKITFTTQQGKCSCGHTKTFLPNEVEEKATSTKRLKVYASELCRFMTASEVSHLLPFSDDTIRRWDKEVLEEQLGKVDLSKVKRLLIDEKSIGKHHKYITLVLDEETGELLYLGQGKSSESLTPFFEQMPENIRRQVMIACMDRTAAYKGVVQKFCPQAEIVYDKFHIVKNLNEAVDQVRREETKKAEKEETPIIKGERYNILRSRENLKPEQRVSLRALLKLNENINAAYMLKEAFRDFWSYRYLGSARKFLSWWLSLALESELRPLITFGRGVCRDHRELLNVLLYGTTNAAMERFNGTVARVIARGFGYKDERYLFLKLRQQAKKVSAIMR